MTKNWYQQWMEYINNNLESFISHFFPSSNQIGTSKSIILNPSPCCGHYECFSFSKEENKPFGYCFSCGATGNHIQIVEHCWGQDEGRQELENWTGIKRDNKVIKMTPEEKYKEKVNEIALHTIELYHYYLMNTEEGEAALNLQLGKDLKSGERAHQIESLVERKIGLSVENYGAVIEMLQRKGYADEEIEAARKLVWAPPGYYVYPYFDNKGRVQRINTKPFRLSCLGNRKGDSYDYSCPLVLENPTKEARRQHEEATGHRMSPSGYATGDKHNSVYINPKIKRKRRYLILVEGENDEISVSEALNELDQKFAQNFLVAAIGGNQINGYFELPFFRNFERIYEAFDPDEAGDKYRKQLNLERPDIPLYHIPFDEAFGDIDAYLKSDEWTGKDDLKALIENAEFIESQHLAFECIKGYEDLWIARNRSFELNFSVMKYNPKQDQFEGKLTVTRGGETVLKVSGYLDKMSVPSEFQGSKLKLSDHLEEHYNKVEWEKGVPVRRFEELLAIIKNTRSYNSVCKQIAWYLYQANEESTDQYQRLYGIIRKEITNQKTIAEILQEVNAYSNQDFDGSEIAPFIRLSQHFDVKNHDAFFYFSRPIKDGEEWKIVPCLLTDKQEEIRLDLIQRKDPQSMLLIKNRYQLRREVKTAVMQAEEVSLQPYWVDKWKNGELTDEELSPATLVKQIEDFIGRVYYFPENRKKVLAIWIYATYYYMMFQSGFPYLLFTGEKGTGKSTLDLVISLFALNAKIALRITDSALYRTIDFEGGTFILDETENLDNKKTVDQSSYATILKGGYSDTAYVYLSDPDQGNATVRFSVFGPKVISNINGLDDVIADRCLVIRTYRVSEEKVKGLEKINVYMNERRAEVHEVTSKCAISALLNYKKVHAIFHELDGVQTGNLRLNQIIHPLMTIAKLVGEDYEEQIMEFYHDEVKGTKDEINEGSVEGMIKRILRTVSQEVTDVIADKWITDVSSNHLYTSPITYSATLQRFEIDTLQIKLLCEEIDTEADVSLKLVKKTLDNLLGPKYKDEETKPRRTTIALVEENLIRLFNGKKSIRVYKYLLDVEDFLTRDEFKRFKEKQSLDDLAF